MAPPIRVFPPVTGKQQKKYQLLPQEITGGRTKSAQVSRTQVVGYQDKKVE